jgi:outer membrane protein W
MTKITGIIFLCLSIVLFIPLVSKGQTTDCSSNYEKALLLYNKGIADSALRVLQPCLENKRNLKSLSKETSGRIFRLAALSSIMTGNPGDAEKYVKQMLEFLPDYKNSKNEGDIMEFSLMLDKVTAIPSLRVSIEAGINIPFSKITKQYSNYQAVAGSASLNSSAGYIFGISCEKMLTKKFSLEAGVEIGRYKFKYSVKGVSEGQIVYNQNINSIEIPVIARYYFTDSRFRPYVEGGVAGRLLPGSSDKSDIYGKYRLTNSSGSDKILTTFLTNIEYFNMAFGAGAAYDLKKISIRLDIRYNQSFANKNLTSGFDKIGGYSDIPPTEKFYYTNDINLISFNNLQISLGLVYNLRYKVF